MRDDRFSACPRERGSLQLRTVVCKFGDVFNHLFPPPPGGGGLGWGHSVARSRSVISVVTIQVRNPISQAPTDVLRHGPDRCRETLGTGWLAPAQRVQVSTPSPLGPFIVDFLCLEANLVIEVNGEQHVQAAGYDRDRTLFLKEQGFRVIRFWNGQVFQRTDEVVEEVSRNLVWTRENQPGSGVPPP